jgi:hypothetical protein
VIFGGLAYRAAAFRELVALQLFCQIPYYSRMATGSMTSPMLVSVVRKTSTFAPQATDSGRFEDYARRIYPEYVRLNLPTWFVGPALGSGLLIDPTC